MKDKYLVELLLPVVDNEGKAYDESLFTKVKEELVKHFGGLTSHSRSPATGLWKKDSKQIDVDRIIIYEVVTDDLDRDFWAMYRGTLEHRFSQESIMIRCTRFELL